MAFKEVQNIQLDTPQFREVQDIQLDEGPGFVERVGDDISERAQAMAEFVGRQESPFLESPKTLAVGLGQVAGGIGDIVGEGVVSGYQTIVPEETQEDIKNTLADFAQTPAGKLGISALKKGQAAFNEFEKTNPDAALALGSILNIVGLGVGTKGTKLTAKELLNIGDDLSLIAGKTIPKQTEKIIAQKTKKAIEKSIRPSVVKGRTAAQAKQFFEKANEAVQTIIENKTILGLTDEAGDIVQGLPTNLRQFSQAVGNTKKEIFKQYDKIAKASGEAGATINLSNIGPELDAIINNKGLRAVNPEIIQYAEGIKDNLSKIGDLNAQEAQDAIASLNNKLGSITDFNSAAKASVDSLVANKLRTELNEVIEKTTGKQYKQLKKKYGSLKEIERDVNRRAMVDARKNVKGLIDFTDVFTGAEVVSGIVSMQPALVAKGAFGKVVATYHKMRNDPNRILKNMFTDVEKIIDIGQKLKKPMTPKSLLIKGVTRKP